MSRKRRLLLNGGVIALALGVLAVDRLLLSEEAGMGPASADAVESAGGTLDLGAGSVARGAKAGDLSPPDDFGERLAEYDTVDPQRDPFRLSKAMLAMVQAAAPEEDRSEEKSDLQEPQSTKTFQSSHRLDAVLVSEEASVAIVNRLAVRLGESVDGFVLVAVGDRSATFERGKDRVTLTLSLE